MASTAQLRAPACMPLHGPVASRRQALLPLSSSSSYLGTRIPTARPAGVVHTSARPRRKCGSAAQPVLASILGVGAPEAILVGVVALLVFGPKGLAQAAKGLGQTLRAFQPTIRELTQVSAELKSTLEAEIGLDEIRSELTRPSVPTPKPAVQAPIDGSMASASGQVAAEEAGLAQLAAGMQTGLRAMKEDAAAAIDPEIERKRAEAAALAWGGDPPQAAPMDKAPSSSAAAETEARSLESMSIAELEQELQRRKAAVAAGQVPTRLSADE